MSTENNQQRELFASRIGFILMSAGCAIGLGNVWRFPYIVGEYGGGLFVLLYLFFLAFLGFPIMLMELSVGRAGRSTLPGALRNLQNPASRFPWAVPAKFIFVGNLILLMFYTVVTGWLVGYAVHFCSGGFNHLSADGCGDFFNSFLADPQKQIFYMVLMVEVTFLLCLGGVQKTVERSVKFMMIGLFVLLIALVIQALRLPDAMKGVDFFLRPSTANFVEKGLLETIHAAMAQAFFTLSLGIGSIAICGSYIGRDRSLSQEGVWIIVLDTFMAICSGLIVFPACAAFSVDPGEGPALIFVTLPNVFRSMSGGVVWGCVFFIFLTIAALSTLVAVFENLVAYGMDEYRWSRKKSCIIFNILLLILSLPCIFGFNLWKEFQPLGQGSTILDLEDFIVSSNLLPLGALYLTIFCTRKAGWGINNFYTELNTGKGWSFPRFYQTYLRWILPVVIVCIWLLGLLKQFGVLD